MATQLSRREKMLAIGVCTILFLLVNLAVFRFLTGTRVRLLADIETKRVEMDTLDTLFEERELWEQRNVWIAAHQPQLTNPDSAGVQLLEEVKKVAQQNGVLLENPALAAIEPGPERKSVPVTVETKSTWPALIAFLANLQAPGKFIVIESANLRVDSSDATQMRGKFRIAKWYAP